MRRKSIIKMLAVLLSAAMAAAMLPGCSSDDSDDDSISVYLWSSVMYDNYAPYIQEQLPDVDIEFIVGTNDLDFYKFVNENGKLPDIITCRRFSLYDAKDLKEELVDLSSTEMAGALYDTYLSNFTNADGSVNWLPVCGEEDGIVDNKALFNKYNIPLPTDYNSFVSACKEFEKHGITGFTADFAYDYTCMEILQGLSISDLSSMEGREWRSEYENPSTDGSGLDDKIWPEAFRRMEKFIEDTGLSAEDAGLDYDPVMEKFANGEIAMIRSGGSNTVQLNNEGFEAVFLPYFCEDGSEWILTYPAFQIAVSKSAEASEERKEDALKVLDVMLSEEAQNIMSVGQDAITYSRNVEMKTSPHLDNLKPIIEKNHMYIRIASNDFFAVSLDVVQKMLTGEYDAEKAYEEFDRQLRDTSVPESEIVLSQDKSYSGYFNEDGGRPSSSAMANSLRECYGSDILIAPSYSFTETVFKGDYTEKNVTNMIMPNPLQVWKGKLTGAELKAYVRASVEGVEGGFNPFNEGALPAVSGIEIEVEEEDGDFVLKSVTMDGKELGDGDRFTVAALGLQPYVDAILSKTGIKLKAEEVRVAETWLEYIKGGAKVAEPASYITLD